MVLSFLYKCVRVFCEYFKELEEESIRDNFVIVYELLDELMDFGFPQSTDSKILQEYITQEGHKLEEVRPPPALTQTVSWRSDGLKYRKNEVFLDVIESVNLLVNLFTCLSNYHMLQTIIFFVAYRLVQMQMFFVQKSMEQLKCVFILVACLNCV
jgi:AP-1 complex subunit mu